jgi:hypothetical protein
MQNRQIASATRAEGRGGEMYKRLLPYTTVGHVRGVRQLQCVGYGISFVPGVMISDIGVPRELEQANP